MADVEHAADQGYVGPSSLESSTGIVSSGGGVGSASTTETLTANAPNKTQTDNSPSSASATPPQLPEVKSSAIDVSSYQPQLDFQGMYSNLLTPVAGQAQEQFSALKSQTEAFSQQAGPFRQFDSSVLENALQPGADLTKAKEYAGAQYTGPTGLGQEFDTTAAKIANLYDYYGGPEDWGYTGALRQTGEVYPTLTPGERAYEAKQVYRDPNYLAGTEKLQTALGRLYEGVPEVRSTAEAIAQARKGQEEDIRTQTAAWGASKQSDIDKELQAAIDRAGKADEAYRAAAQQFKDTGSLESLMGIPQANLAFDPNQLNTEDRKLFEEGKKAFQGIWDKYSNIKDVPTLQLSANERGSQLLVLDPAWLEQNQNKYTPEQLNKIYNQAWRRQYELEDAGFGATSYRGGKFHTTANDFPTIPYSGTESYSTGGSTKYAGILPLYSTPWQPRDIRGYVTETPGTEPTKENLATSDQRRVYNTISEILGTIETNKLNETEPYKVAQLGMEVQKYLEDEKADLARKKEQLTQEDWSRFIALRDLDHQFVAAKNKGLFGDIFGGVGGYLGLLGGGAAGALGGYLGGQLLGQKVG